jgi:four helix bundle protein
MKQLLEFRGLEVRRVAVQLAVHCQTLSRRLPNDEEFGLSQQIRRSAVSVASNIAEGFGRRSPRGYAHYLTVAQCSLLELDTQLEIAHGAGYVQSEDLTEVVALVTQVAQMIDSLMPLPID